MKTLRLAVLAVISGAWTGAAFAAPGWYGGLDLGTDRAAGWCSAVDFFASCKETSVAGRAILGYQIDDFLSVEGSYLTIGNLTGSGVLIVGGTNNTVSYKSMATSFEFAAVGTMKITETLAVQARLGAADTSVKLTVSAPGLSPSYYSNSSNAFTGVPGIGIRFAPTKHLAIRAMLDYYGKVGSDSQTYSERLTTMTVGFTWAF
jgi:hypothetical protein